MNRATYLPIHQTSLKKKQPSLEPAPFWSRLKKISRNESFKNPRVLWCVDELSHSAGKIDGKNYQLSLYKFYFLLFCEKFQCSKIACHTPLLSYGTLNGYCCVYFYNFFILRVQTNINNSDDVFRDSLELSWGKGQWISVETRAKIVSKLELAS